MRSTKPLISQQTLKAIYFSQFQSIILYGNSAHSTRVFRMQKRIIRIMKGKRSRDSCRKLFSHLKILPLPSLYIFSILRFVMKNRELFTTNNEIHHHGTPQTDTQCDTSPRYTADTQFSFSSGKFKKVSVRSVLHGYKNIQ